MRHRIYAMMRHMRPRVWHTITRFWRSTLYHRLLHKCQFVNIYWMMGNAIAPIVHSITISTITPVCFGWNLVGVVKEIVRLNRVVSCMDFHPKYWKIYPNRFSNRPPLQTIVTTVRLRRTKMYVTFMLPQYPQTLLWLQFTIIRPMQMEHQAAPSPLQILPQRDIVQKNHSHNCSQINYQLRNRVVRLSHYNKHYNSCQLYWYHKIYGKRMKIGMPRHFTSVIRWNDITQYQHRQRHPWRFPQRTVTITTILLICIINLSKRSLSCWTLYYQIS